MFILKCSKCPSQEEIKEDYMDCFRKDYEKRKFDIESNIDHNITFYCKNCKNTEVIG